MAGVAAVLVAEALVVAEPWEILEMVGERVVRVLAPLGKVMEVDVEMEVVRGGEYV